jgi:RNA polymerase sigma-70 factor (ECF subfamily)
MTETVTFENTIIPLRKRLYGGAIRLTKNHQTAEDLVQDTMLRAFRFWDSFTHGSDAVAWAFTIMRNSFINNYNKDRRRGQILERASHTVGESSTPMGESTTPNLDDEVEFHLHRPLIHEALEALPPDFRTAVVLCDLEGLSYREIAEVMDCPMGTVMSRIHRGRAQLRVALGNKIQRCA